LARVRSSDGGGGSAATWTAWLRLPNDSSTHRVACGTKFLSRYSIATGAVSRRRAKSCTSAGRNSTRNAVTIPNSVK
jgi:hypothetical protein